MVMNSRITAVLIPALAVLAFAAPAAATSGTTSEAVSENWAGYEATTTNSDGFGAVSGSWVQPTVKASSARSYSAYWVGLGGGDENSDALEQDGTQADVAANGTVSYYAWYELVPSAPVKIPVAVHAGDKIYARTYVKGDEVTFTLDNQTTGTDWTKTVAMTQVTPDTSTAEWVAEAPSACEGSAASSCSVLNLADFGTVTFTDAHARSDGAVKSISGWDSEAIEMSPSAASTDGYGGGFGGPDTTSRSTGTSEGAAPGDLSANGSSFTVTYAKQSAVSDSAGDGDSGYGDSGYGDSGYGDSGYGYGDSGFGDSAYGYGESAYGDGYGYGDSGYGDSGDGGVYGGGSGYYGYLTATQAAVLNALSGYSESYYANAGSGAAGY
jgi:hypothetical protein